MFKSPFFKIIFTKRRRYIGKICTHKSLRAVITSGVSSTPPHIQCGQPNLLQLVLVGVACQTRHEIFSKSQLRIISRKGRLGAFSDKVV